MAHESNKLSGNCHIILRYENGDAGYDLRGDKTDLKDLIFSLMCSDPVFAGLCAVAVLEIIDGFDTSTPQEKFEKISTLAREQLRYKKRL